MPVVYTPLFPFVAAWNSRFPPLIGPQQRLAKTLLWIQFGVPLLYFPSTVLFAVFLTGRRLLPPIIRPHWNQKMYSS